MVSYGEENARAMSKSVRRKKNEKTVTSPSGRAFVSVSSSRSISEVSVTLAEAVLAGKMDVDDFVLLVNCLKMRSAQSATKSDFERPSATGCPSGQRRGGDGSIRPARRPYVEINMGNDLVAQEHLDYCDRNELPHHYTTIIESAALTSFDGSEYDSDAARDWLRRFEYHANLSGWTSIQRVDAFTDKLSYPSKCWLMQLPRNVRRDWKSLRWAFHAKFYVDEVSLVRLYHHLEQGMDETPLEIFYRLNDAAIRAKLDIRHSSQAEDSHVHTTAPVDLKYHLDFFWDVLRDRELVDLFRFRTFNSVGQVEELLRQHNNSMDTLNGQEKRERAPNRHPSDGHPVANYEEHNSNNSVRCDRCGRNGHVKNECYQLLVCDHCNKTGHDVARCREFIHKMMELRSQEMKGEITWNEFAEELKK